MKKLYLKLFVLYLIGIQGLNAQLAKFTLPVAEVTIQVRGERDEAIENAEVRFGFQNRITRKMEVVVGVTTPAGEFTGQGGSDSVVGCDVKKGGFYASGAPIPPFKDAKYGRWQPWNPTVRTVLRKIENPSPTYAKSAWIEIPTTNAPCGYDLETGDWVKPYGSGSFSDLVFAASRQFTNRQDFDAKVEITFSNPEDGIQETKLPEEWGYSTFKWPRSAPESGYISAFASHLSRKPGSYYQMDTSKEQRFFFRVRTVVRDGRIVSARYGKISGGFELAPAESKTCKVKLSYYLSPKPLDRNMEFDLTRNMVKNISQFEAPREP